VSAPAAAVPALREALERVLACEDLTRAQTRATLDELVAADTPPALQGAFLAALRAKGETPAELAGLAEGLLARARLVARAPGPCLDTAGTGGDGAQSFNLSSAAALLVASLGVPVAKHGNRAVSSRAGSADLFEALGVALPETPAAASAALARDGFVFLFAPRFHPAAAALAAVRRELGVRTAFNLLGPLVNPARPSHQLVGAATPATAARLARTALVLGTTRTFVVHGQIGERAGGARGYDEATPCGPLELHDVLGGVAGGSVRVRRVEPLELGLARCEPAALAGGSAAENAATLVALFAGEARGARRDAVCLNAALALCLLDGLDELPAALSRARAALDDGRAARLLARLRAAPDAEGGAP
jgi:anthranilate phosphoribosyltransferase